MLMIKTIITFHLSFFSLFSVVGQDKQTSNASKDLNQHEYFSCSQIGWKLKIPPNWSLKSQNDNPRNEQLLKSIESELGTEIGQGMSECQVVIERDKSNLVKSSIEKLEIEDSTELELMQSFAKRLIVQVYQKAGLKTEVSETRKEIIGGTEFSVFSILLHNAETAQDLRQLMYSGYINGYDFTFLITYTKEEFRDEILDHFKASDFRKR